MQPASPWQKSDLGDSTAFGGTGNAVSGVPIRLSPRAVRKLLLVNIVNLLGMGKTSTLGIPQ